MKQSKKLVFFGNERLSSGYEATGAPVLTGLINAGYEVVAVVANYEQGRSRKNRELEVAEVANRHNIPLLLPDRPLEVISQLKSFEAVAGVLAAYGKIVPQTVIDVFPHGILNIHPSLLPKYRGPTPIEQAMLDGATETGVTIMQLAKRMDAGPLYAQSVVPLTGNETKATLTQRLIATGMELLLGCLPRVINNELTPEPQNETAATYCQLINKRDGVLDWQKPAIQLEREVRAYLGWPGSRTTLFEQELTVLAAEVSAETHPAGSTHKTTAGVIVGCGKQSLLITKLRPSGRSSMSAVDFLRGLRTT